MTREELCSTRYEVLDLYSISGKLISCQRYGGGHINDTFCAVYESENNEAKYILQRINTDVFKNVEKLMDNIYRVTSFLAEKIKGVGGNAERETMTILKNKNGEIFSYDKNNSAWRIYTFVDKSITIDAARNIEDFYNASYAFGTFQNMLSDFPSETLFETIEGFHNTIRRYNTFLDVVEKDCCSRALSVREEIQFYIDHKADMEIYLNMKEAKKLPLRVTHNDTKLNNVLFDEQTQKGLCVIDLDTVMPGFAGFDFGDSIRFGASTAAEDEIDLSKVHLDEKLFLAGAEGFIAGCKGSLTETELKLLPMGAKIMMLECGMRFLTDYIDGDNYFKIHRERQNLDRCRTQIKLAQEFEEKEMLLDKIIDEIISK